MIKKGNGFLRFVFSCLPGAGEMYMGFMKRGISTMALFFGVCTLVGMLGISYLFLMICVLWFYSFFYVHNLAGLEDAEFYALEDDYLFHLDALAGVKNNFLLKNRVIAILLIVFGSALLFDGIFFMLERILPEGLGEMMYEGYYAIRYELPQVVIGIVIIGFGIWLIRGKKAELDQWEEKQSKVLEDKSDGK